MAEIFLGAILEGGETCSADIVERHCVEVLGTTVRAEEDSPISKVCRAIKTFFALRARKFFYTVCPCFYNNNVYKNQERAAVVMKEKAVGRRARLLQTAWLTF